MNHIPGILIAIVIVIHLMSGIVSAEEPTERQRVSIAISGGASKAYEAGLNWAILKLVRESEELHTLSGGQIRPLELASVAGAGCAGVVS